MGIIRKGANGGYSGKVGSTIGSSWKGIDYIKGLPKKSSKPATQAQLEQQAKFKIALNFLKSLASLLHLTFSSIGKKKLTGFNCAIQLLLKNSVIGTYPTYEIDFPSVKLSDGRLNVPKGQAAGADPAKVLLTWSPKTSEFNAFADDKITVLLYDPSENYFDSFSSGVLRSAGELEIELESSMVGQTVHVYYFFTSRDGKMYSPSMYAGSVNIR